MLKVRWCIISYNPTFSFWGWGNSVCGGEIHLGHTNRHRNHCQVSDIEIQYSLNLQENGVDGKNVGHARKKNDR